METMVIILLLCYKYYDTKYGAAGFGDSRLQSVGSEVNCRARKGERMAKRTKLQIGVETVEGVDLDFRTLREEWNEYETEDGTRIRVKLVVSGIIRTDRYDHQTDQPIYVVQSGNIVVTKALDELKEELRRR